MFNPNVGQSGATRFGWLAPSESGFYQPIIVAACLLGIPASEMLNQSVPIAAVKGTVQNIRFEKVIQQPNAAARRRALAQALLAAVEPAVLSDHAVLAGIQWLSRHPQSRIEQLSRWIGISERQLHRRFSAAIGCGPK
jgi:hypothetical protein